MIKEGVCGESRLRVKDESWQVLVGEGPQGRKGWPEKVLSLHQWSDLGRGRGDGVRRSPQWRKRQTLERSSLSLSLGKVTKYPKPTLTDSC